MLRIVALAALAAAAHAHAHASRRRLGFAAALARPRRHTAALRAADKEQWLAAHPEVVASVALAKAGGVDGITAPRAKSAEALDATDTKRVMALLDWLQERLISLSPDSAMLNLSDSDDQATMEAAQAAAASGDDGGAADLDFVVEGRRLLAVSRLSVLHGDDAATCGAQAWAELQGLLEADEDDSGLLLALPFLLGDVKKFLADEVAAPLAWLGFEGEAQVHLTAWRAAEGAPHPAVRVILRPSAPPTEESDAMAELMNPDDSENLKSEPW